MTAVEHVQESGTLGCPKCGSPLWLWAHDHVHAHVLVTADENGDLDVSPYSEYSEGWDSVFCAGCHWTGQLEQLTPEAVAAKAGETATPTTKTGTEDTK
jgi:hypothetical protein